MHRNKGSFKSTAIRKYRENVKRINTRKVGSIWEVIDNPNLQIFQKVDYIRHHFVYYDGNYDLFYDKDGKPNKTKKMLDEVIKGVINKTIDPSELTALNKIILKEHKDKIKQTQLAKEIELEQYVQEKASEEMVPNEVILDIAEKQIEKTPELATYKKGITNAEVYFDMIDKYLATLSPEDRAKAEQWSYKDLKRVAKWWMKNNKPNVSPVEIKEAGLKKQGFGALLAGYRKYAEKEWKNTDENESI